MSTLRATLPRPSPIPLLALLAVVVGPLLTAAAVRSPVLGLAPVAAALVLGLAWRSIAYPLGLAGFSIALIALRGSSPFPHGVEPVLTSGWAAAAGALLLLRGRARLPRSVLRSPPVLATLGLLVLLLARLPASADPSYGHSKLSLFVLNNVVLLLAGLLLAQRRREIDLFLVLMLALDAFSGLLILLGVAQDASSPLNRNTLVGENVIALGIQGARGLMVATYLALRGRRGWMRTVALVLLPLTAVALLASGSRGPVIGGLVGELVILALLFRGRARTPRLLALVAAALVTVVAVAQFVPEQALSRSTSVLTGDDGGRSSNGRSQLWSAAANAFADHPLVGVGTGSFPVAARATACPGPGCGDDYPHNALLELAAELGIAGLALGLAFLGSSTRHLVRAVRAASAEPEPVIVAGLFAGSLVTAMLTGDISGNGNLWLAAGLAVGFSLLGGRHAAQPAEAAAPGSARTGPRARPAASRG